MFVKCAGMKSAHHRYLMGASAWTWMLMKFTRSPPSPQDIKGVTQSLLPPPPSLKSTPTTSTSVRARLLSSVPLLCVQDYYYFFLTEATGSGFYSHYQFKTDFLLFIYSFFENGPFLWQRIRAYSIVIFTSRLLSARKALLLGGTALRRPDRSVRILHEPDGRGRPRLHAAPGAHSETGHVGSGRRSNHQRHRRLYLVRTYSLPLCVFCSFYSILPSDWSGG